MTGFGQYDGDDVNVKGDDGSDDGVKIGAIDDSGTKRLAVDALFTARMSERVVYMADSLRDGSAANLNVDGSGTPAVYSLEPGAGEIHYVSEIAFYISDPGANDELEFGNLNAELTNGLLIEQEINGTDYQLANIKNNIDITLIFNQAPSSTPPGQSATYSGVVELDIPIELKGDDSDKLKVTVRDDLTAVKALFVSYRAWKVLT